jgi:DnaA initiator-associating protein
MIDNIKANFTESIQTKIAASEVLPQPIADAAAMMVEALIRGNKILSCGNGVFSKCRNQVCICRLSRCA